VGLHRTLQCPLDTFVRYCQALADRYVSTNTYHNFTHATDVLLVFCHLVLECGGARRMTDLEVTASFLAAHAHDVGHPGTNNQYQVAAKTPLGDKYGKNATLETYSVDLGEELLEQYHVLAAIPPQDRSLLLAVFRSTILGTDMGQHQTTCLALRHLPTDFYTHNYPPKRPGRSTTNGDTTHALSLPALLVHAADLSGPSRQKIPIWITRSLAVTREFVYQGDCEREMRLPVTSAFDRRVLLPEGLEGFQRRENEFTKGVILPYYRDVERVWAGIRPLRVAIETNLRGWEKGLDMGNLKNSWMGIFQA
jgi:3'5'-cyclic nucleotide phosphodiesterase